MTRVALEPARTWRPPDDAGSGNPDPTMHPKGGHPGESVHPPRGGEDIGPESGDRPPEATQTQTKKRAKDAPSRG